MSGKWTPGPWEWCKDSPTDVIVSKPCECSLATIDVGCGNHAERQSNARLIAAAPELAEALEAMIERFGHDIFTMPPEDRDLLTRAVSVLAKAKGEGA